MSTQAINRPHRKAVSQLFGLLLDHFAQEQNVGLVRFGRPATAGFVGQFFNPATQPALNPGVDGRDANGLHFSDLCRFMSQMKEANGCTPLTHFRTLIPPDGCLNSLELFFSELIISGFWHSSSLSRMTVC